MEHRSLVSSGITDQPSVTTTTYTSNGFTSDHGCVSTGTVTVTVHPLPSVTIDGDKDICVGGSTVLTASGGSNYPGAQETMAAVSQSHQMRQPHIQLTATVTFTGVYLQERLKRYG